MKSNVIWRVGQGKACGQCFCGQTIIEISVIGWMSNGFWKLCSFLRLNPKVGAFMLSRTEALRCALLVIFVLVLKRLCAVFEFRERILREIVGDKMVKKRKQKENSRGVAAMGDDAQTAADPDGNAGGEAMDTADVDVPEPTGAELDLLQSKKKKKKKGSKSNGLQIQGLIGKKEPPKRKAVKQRKEKSIERALLNMEKQQEKLQKDGVKAERVSASKNLY